MKRIIQTAVFLFLAALASSVCIGNLRYVSEASRLSETIVFSDRFRSQPVPPEIEEQLKGTEQPGELLGLYWLETGFAEEEAELSLAGYAGCRKRWERADGWKEYLSACRAVWDDAVCFPVPEQAGSRKTGVSFENSWMFGRSYKGERRHEGTDLIPSANERGVIPVVSMTDGVVEHMGWLELGGWRIGIRAPGGAYFYYAHLDSYAELREGDTVEAGDFLGYMGDSGYGAEEGTKGKFPVHLHLGIYLEPDGREVSVNPYPLLRWLSGA